MAALPINNPQRILRTLDSFLENQTRVVLFGRAALALGFGDNGARFGRTQDVGAILPTLEMAKIESDAQFWTAIDLTNKKLEPSGLYLSHLFTDRQVALTSDWLEKIVPINMDGYKCLQLFRPSVLDPILTKMMRNDREDLEDIRFLLRREAIGQNELDAAFHTATKLEVPELRALFEQMQPVVRKIALEIEVARADIETSTPSTVPLDPDWWSKMTQPPSIEKSLENDRGMEL